MEIKCSYLVKDKLRYQEGVYACIYITYIIKCTHEIYVVPGMQVIPAVELSNPKRSNIIFSKDL